MVSGKVPSSSAYLCLCCERLSGASPKALTVFSKQKHTGLVRTPDLVTVLFVYVLVSSGNELFQNRDCIWLSLYPYLPHIRVYMCMYMMCICYRTTFEVTIVIASLIRIVILKLCVNIGDTGIQLFWRYLLKYNYVEEFCSSQ